MLDVTADASSVASLNAEFVGNAELVRVTGSDQTLTGAFWTTKDAISDANGTLLSAQEIRNVLALNYTPTNIVYGGVIAPGSELYVGIVGPQEYAPEGGGVIQLFVKSGAITGARNVPIP